MNLISIKNEGRFKILKFYEHIKEKIMDIEEFNIISGSKTSELNRAKSEYVLLRYKKSSHISKNNKKNKCISKNIANDIYAAACICEIRENQLIIKEAIEQIKIDIKTLNVSFNNKLKYDLHKDTIIDKLHKELQEYKNDIILQSINPIINDLIGMYDDFESSISSYKEKENSEVILNILTDFQLTVLEILEKHDVFAYKSPDTSFVSKRQQVIKTVKTDDPGKHHEVKQHLRIGFDRDGKVVRPERVEVFVYRPPEEKEKSLEDDIELDRNEENKHTEDIDHV